MTTTSDVVCSCGCGAIADTVDWDTGVPENRACVWERVFSSLRTVKRSAPLEMPAPSAEPAAVAPKSKKAPKAPKEEAPKEVSAAPSPSINALAAELSDHIVAQTSNLLDISVQKGADGKQEFLVKLKIARGRAPLSNLTEWKGHRVVIERVRVASNAE